MHLNHKGKNHIFVFAAGNATCSLVVAGLYALGWVVYKCAESEGNSSLSLPELFELQYAVTTLQQWL